MKLDNERPSSSLRSPVRRASVVIQTRIRRGYAHRSNPNRCLNNIDRGHHLTVKRAGIEPGFRLYDFRHTFGSRSAMAGVDLATLKELMGHTSITTTLRYVHPTPEHKRQAMEKLEQFNAEHALLAQAQNTGSP